MTIEAVIVADSISPTGTRLTTMQLRYPKFVHGEFMTHRVFSRNASSSRAIPVERLIEDLERDSAMPIYWGRNQPGMQAREEQHTPVMLGLVEHSPPDAWAIARGRAIEVARAFAAAGYHKQIVNRLLEPFCHINVVVTATEWDNFFTLRCHPDAQPEMCVLANAMRNAMTASTPFPLGPGEWHLPYAFFTPFLRERLMPSEWPILGIRLSVARCARVSYRTHDGRDPSLEEDLALYDRLASAVPMHASPMEHQATPDTRENPVGEEWIDWAHPHQHGNFVGWRQYRKMVEAQKPSHTKVSP